MAERNGVDGDPGRGGSPRRRRQSSKAPVPQQCEPAAGWCGELSRDRYGSAASPSTPPGSPWNVTAPSGGTCRGPSPGRPRKTHRRADTMRPTVPGRGAKVTQREGETQQDALEGLEATSWPQGSETGPAFSASEPCGSGQSSSIAPPPAHIAVPSIGSKALAGGRCEGFPSVQGPVPPSSTRRPVSFTASPTCRTPPALAPPSQPPTPVASESTRSATVAAHRSSMEGWAWPPALTLDKGVRYSAAADAWIGDVVVDGRKHTQSFSVRQFGWHGAKSEAVHWKLSRDQQMAHSAAQPEHSQPALKA
eukprot:GHVT01033431.1.p1 GENE.GHVT01033431.1~~GHVT01033431.1.p1  ORF type:complete len:307 (-),score=57.17 GHVT01033431.1:227-1147(-)